MKYLWWIVLFSFLVVVSVILTYPDNNLRIIVCDVGQGDGILIQRAFLQILVDGGPDSRVLSCFARHKPFWDTRVEVAIISHPQVDHFGGITPVLERFSVDTLIMSGVPSDSKAYRRLIAALETQSHTRVISPYQGLSLQFDDLELDFIWPPESVGSLDQIVNHQKYVDTSNIEDVNQISNVFTIKYGGFSALFTGDIGLVEEVALIKKGLLTKVDVLKVPHHGSKYSSSQDFLEIVYPEVGLISAGKTNRFGHPHTEVLDRLAQLDVRIHQTNQQGDIVVVSNGERYWVEE